MAYRARLIFRRLVMSGSARTQNRECMALQAQEVDLTDPQETWIVRPVRRVATGASFGLHGYVFIDKGALLVGVTFHANLISTGKSPDLPQCGCAVNVVAIAAVDKTFIHAVVI